MRKEVMDIFLGVFFIAFSLAVYALMRDFPPGTVAEGMGPAFIPGLLIGALVVLSIILIVSALARGKRGDQSPAADGPIFSRNLKSPAILTLIVSLYLLSLNFIGFLLGTSVFILLTMKAMGAKLKSGILMGVCLTVLIYVVFALALQVPLPPGHIMEFIVGG